MENQIRILASFTGSIDTRTVQLDGLEDALKEIGMVRIQEEDLYVKSVSWGLVIDFMVVTGGVLTFLDYLNRIIRHVWADAESKVNKGIEELKASRPGGNVEFRFPVTTAATISLPYLEGHIPDPAVVSWFVEKMPEFVQQKFPTAEELRVVVTNGHVDLIVYQDRRPSYQVSLPSEDIQVVRPLSIEETIRLMSEAGDRARKEYEDFLRKASTE